MLEHLRQTAPPDWLFRRAIVDWFDDPALLAQLPLPYRLLGLYYRAYFALRPGAQHLPRGRYLLHAITHLQRALPGDGYATLRIGDLEVCLDLYDARFLQVVHELHAPDVAFDLHHFLKPGDTFIDVGANQGAFSIIASRLVGAGGRVIAFEPQARLAAATAASLRRTPVPHAVHSIALGSRESTVDLIVPNAYSGMAGLYQGFSGLKSHRTTPVPLRRLDDVAPVDSLPGDVFVKLDIEGGEYGFFQGARGFIRARRPRVMMEVNPNATRAAGTDPAAFVRLLADLGYASFAYASDLATEHPLAHLTFERQRNVVLRAAA